jgi:hypothetical protein
VRTVVLFDIRAVLGTGYPVAGWARAATAAGIMDSMAEPLLIWLVLYAALLATVGFVLMIGRAATGRPRSHAVLLRSASMAAFVLALAVWLAFLILDP